MTQEDRIKDVKKKLDEFINEAENSVKKINEGSVIPNCEVYNLVHLVGDTDKAYGAATILHELYPEDGDISRMWDKSYDINASAYKGRNRFDKKCLCLNKDRMANELKNVLSKYKYI